MSKVIRIVLSEEAEEVYHYLNKEAAESKKLGRKSVELQVFKAFQKKKELIKENPHYGEPISKKKIPANYIRNYGIKNLFWVSLPHGWRMFYTLTEGSQQIEVIAFVLNIFSHRKYEKKFGYKKV